MQKIVYAVPPLNGTRRGNLQGHHKLLLVLLGLKLYARERFYRAAHRFYCDLTIV